MFRLLCAGLALFLAGCSVTRKITITAKPPDAMVQVDGMDRGRGPVMEPFVFGGKVDTHTVKVSRLGYKEQSITLRKDFEGDRLNVELKYLTRRVAINVRPAAGTISVDGRQIGTVPTESTSVELEFTVDPDNNWTKHAVRAERKGFEPAVQVVSWQDQKQSYTLELAPRKKDLTISTTPAGAQVYLDDQLAGTSPVVVTGRSFPADLDSGEVIPQHVKAMKKGYPDVEAKIAWDEGKTEYSLNLIPLTKTVKIETAPAGGSISIDQAELPRDSSGVSSATLMFPPTDEKGELKTYTAIVSKKTADTEWYPQNLLIGWDDGKTDYTVRLREIRTRPVMLLSAVLERSDEGWDVVPKITRDTLAWKDVSEANPNQPPVQLTRLPKGTQIDTLAVSPDGANVLFTILYGTDKANFRSQILMIRSDASQGADYLNDGKSLEITPSFTPGGDKIVFSSNRAGKRLSVWRMSAVGAPGIEQLTTGDTNDLWPVIDSDPKARLFYQASVDTRPDPRMYMTVLGTVTRTDLTTMAGSQPRISPKNDAIVFAAVNDKTGKRDLYLMGDKGGAPQNLTNSPDVDEFDAAWSKDGTRIAYVCDAGVDEDRHRNYDIWMIEVARPERPAQITTNGSWDDHPAWDPSGSAVYFRSNRGGDWAIWKVLAK